ncbi:MAG TPA: hypothetical protein PKW63_12265 [Vicinamibacterales bacterium]|nr:hypothetical protein [Vicinamibacterales bacterium]
MQALGLTARQARFLVHVLVFSGVFLERQYCRFAGIAHGQQSHDFVARLIARGFVTPITPGSVRRGRLYHVQHKPLYEAIGEPDNRHRKPATVGRLIRRLMLLDAVLSDDRYHWLGTERDKFHYFDTVLKRDIPADWYPHLAFGEAPTQTLRLFPEKLPIGVEKHGYRRHVFLYLATRPHPWDYRLFLLRHVSLLKGLPEWRIRVLLPRRLRKAKALYHGAFLDQLVRTLDPWVVEQLLVFFKACRTGGGHVSAPVDPYLATVYQRFGAIRFRALYRTWRRLGDIATGSIAHGMLIRDAYQRGEGGVEYQELRRQYLQLTALIAHDHGPRRGDKRRTRAVVPLFDDAPPSDPPTALVTP